MIPRLLLEEPMLLTAALIVASIAAFFVFNTRGSVKKASLMGGLGLLLAAAVQVLAFSVETAREKIIAATTPLVKATAAADTARLDPMLDSQVKMTNDKGLMSGELPQGGAWDKQRILSEVREQLGNKWRIKDTDVLEVQGVIDTPGHGRTQARVRAVPEVFEVPITTWWRIDWKEDSNGRWLVTGIEPVDLGFPSRLR